MMSFRFNNPAGKHVGGAVGSAPITSGGTWNTGGSHPHQVAKLGQLVSARSYEKKPLSFVISLQRPILRPCECSFSPKWFQHLLMFFLASFWFVVGGGSGESICTGEGYPVRSVWNHPYGSFICIIARNEGCERSAFSQLVHSVYMNKRSFVSLGLSIESPSRQMFVWGQ